MTVKLVGVGDHAMLRSTHVVYVVRPVHPAPRAAGGPRTPTLAGVVPINIVGHATLQVSQIDC